MQDKLINAINTSLIDSTVESAIDLQHKLLVNKNKSKILTSIVRELETCDEFIISVAFITMGGVSALLNVLPKLEKNGIKGRVITGDYLNFTDPKAIEKLDEFSNIEVRLIRHKDFHAKGYFFKKDNNWNIILGSSNLTNAALTKTAEWNIKLSSSENGSFIQETLGEFETIWNQTPDLQEVISDYKGLYENIKIETKLKSDLYQAHLDSLNISESKVYIPNLMQKQALDSLKTLRENGEDKALIISATGTGKTILSAFDVQESKMNRALFIVHRENIAKKSMETYKEMMPEKSVGLFTGNEKKYDADFTFATIQTLVKYKEQFERDHFDYIIIDEVHHGGASTYQNVYDYFTPKFSLGMTATPERTDGFDIFSMYDNNIAFEYSLSSALSEELLAPFHYFGVTEAELDGEQIDEKTAIKLLTSEKRIDHIVEKINYYGHSGDSVHGLIFVSRVEEAIELAYGLNERGYRCMALTGKDSEKSRDNAIDKLEAGELDYLITVDIFNEGVDIPCINQVVLLRPTQSAIVYIQQIGRGLRKVEDKEFVVIIDFIGNYKNNYLIPIAIGNDGTYDKDKLKKDIILNGIDYLEGESLIQFEEVVQDKLMKQISKTNFSTMRNIKKDYYYLKTKYGRIPKLVDFINNKMISPEVILGTKKNYEEIKAQIEENNSLLNKEEKLFLDYLSLVVFPAKRLHEVIILEYLIFNRKATIQELVEEVERKETLINQDKTVENAVAHLARTIFTALSDEYKYIPFVKQNLNTIELTEQFIKALQNETFVNEMNDVLECCKLIYKEENYLKNERVTVGKLYNRKQAYKYMLHDYNNGYQVGGYTPFDNEVLVFITLDNSSSFTTYENTLIDEKTLVWFSTGNRRLRRENGELTTEGRIAMNEIPLQIFMKRNASEKFYYIGQVDNVLNFEETKTAENKPVVKYKLELNKEIDRKLFEYLTKNEK